MGSREKEGMIRDRRDWREEKAESQVISREEKRKTT